MKKIVKKLLFKDEVFNFELLFKGVVLIVVLILLGFMFFDVIPKFIELQSK